MKILHTADWHLGLPRSPYENDMNIRLQDTLNCLEEMLRVAKEEKPDYSLVCGDIFDTSEIRQARGHREVLQARRIIQELARVSGNVIVMRGTPNHDSAEAFEELDAHFEHIPTVYVVTAPQVLQFDDVDIAVLPGFDRGAYRAKFPGISKEDENAVFTQELANIVLGMRAQCRPDKKNIFMAHYTVPGCNVESGQTMLLTQFEPIISQETLLVADYDLVTLGHIHRPQRVTENPWYYSGAINAMNFNDEGQERGFWIHEIEIPYDIKWNHYFHKTPIREFATIELNNEDITQINMQAIDFVATKWRGMVEGKIVRIHYSCTAENSKALNKALLTKALLDDGAFMVWEVLPNKNEDSVNKDRLVNTTDPEANLVKYLEERQIPAEKIQELVLKGRPIIAEAEAGVNVKANTGVFEPVEISVKNYRNYEDETFNFEDITFCTINGQNGAGKSSLFMDAIVDCLFEEPRENELTGWIRNDDNGCKGAIMFTFRIGEKTYRITRTRNRPKKSAKDKTGKATLNLSELVNGEWEDRSKEKYGDTQQEILNILGMDSFTFKSCALIMQDQYGLFLQAKPEERVEVLGTLLGLGVYHAMEKIAADKAKVNGAKGRELENEIEVHNNTIYALGTPDEELDACKNELAGYESSLRAKTEERDSQKLILANQQAAAERRIKLITAIAALQSKKERIEQEKANQQATVDNSTIILDRRGEIEEKVSEHKKLLKRELELAGESALYSAKKQEAENYKRQAELEQESMEGYKVSIRQKEAELLAAQSTEQDEVVKKNAAAYEEQKKLLDAAYEKERKYRAVEQKLTQTKHNLQQLASQYEANVKRMQLKEDGLKKKAELLSSVECVDIANAKCGFLKDAISSQQELKDYPKYYTELESCYLQKKEPLNVQITELEKQLAEIDYDARVVAEISEKVNRLKPYVAQLENITWREGRIALLEADLGHLKENMREAEKRLAESRFKVAEAEKERDAYAKAFEEHIEVMNSIAVLAPWLEKEKQLPVAEERKATAAQRILELTTEVSDIASEISEKQAEADIEVLAMKGIEELTGAVAKLNADVDMFTSLVKEKQMKIGALQQKSEQIAKLKKEIADLQERRIEYSKETVSYETLKAAFSQNGVPHQIIRSIIPQLTSTSNNIIGQMTGGKMGVEFRLEKLQKSGKEKASLDIFIEEDGKTALPYLSKSGGEKVKASLSVILALAEIKSTVAGIQLGMLFIDEPPFLDSDGIQAYCDALETIQNRYNNIKIMAITHDPTMKSRFPQNLDVIKTENGSKVIY